MQLLPQLNVINNDSDSITRVNEIGVLQIHIKYKFVTIGSIF